MSDQTQFDQPSWQTRDVYNVVVNAAEFASEERARSYLRMLAVLSAPVANECGDDRPDGRVLDVWGEWERLRQATDQARDPVSGQGAPWAVVRLVPPTAEALRRALTPHDPGYQVLHFSCHGSPAGLTLEDKLGCERLLSAADLVAALRGTPIRLVVLNACATAKLGRTLVEAGGVPCVIATREPIDDRESKLLSEQLYGYLAAGATVGQALEHARREIAAQMQRGELPVPGSPTERAANLLLFGDGELRLAAEGDPARAPCFILHPVPHNHPLPFEPITGFVGRSRDLLELARWFAAPDRRFFALCGVGGMGKTSLALNAALRHFWRLPAPKTAMTLGRSRCCWRSRQRWARPSPPAKTATCPALSLGA